MGMCKEKVNLDKDSESNRLSILEMQEKGTRNYREIWVTQGKH